MEIIQADKSHKKQVLKLLDDFRTVCANIIEPGKKLTSTSAQECGSKIFEQVIDSDNSIVLLAKDKEKFVGIITLNKIPQIRWGRHCAEIEEMFVIPDCQGKGVATMLIDSAVTWAKKNKIKCIRLESGVELKRAHSFYEKSGFRFYGRAYEKII